MNKVIIFAENFEGVFKKATSRLFLMVVGL